MAKYGADTRTLACGTDANSGGTITGVTAGTGLTGGGTTGGIALALNPAYRAPQGCGNHQIATYVVATTTWACANGVLFEPGTAQTDGAGAPEGTPMIWFKPKVTFSGGTGSYTNEIKVQNDGGFVAESTIGIGKVPVSGGGDRVMWDPYKAGFRAGGVSASAWDDANVGFYSAAVGFDPVASGNYTLASGYKSRAEQSYSTALGYADRAGGVGSVALGALNGAFGNYSVTLGQRAYSGTGCPASGSCNYDTAAITPHDGDFVFSDDSATEHFGVSANNMFAARAIGGVKFVTSAGGAQVEIPGGTGDLHATGAIQGGAGNPTACDIIVADDTCLYDEQNGTFSIRNAAGDAYATAKALAFVSTSDRHAKQNFGRVDAQAVLARVAALPITTWNFKVEHGKPRHIGPMAQDFFRAFHVGADNKHIATTDADGVLFASVKALYSLDRQKDARIKRQGARIQKLERDNARINARLDRIERLLAQR